MGLDFDTVGIPRDDMADEHGFFSSMQDELKLDLCLSRCGQDGMEARLVDLFHSTIQASGMSSVQPHAACPVEENAMTNACTFMEGSTKLCNQELTFKSARKCMLVLPHPGFTQKNSAKLEM